MVPELDTLPTPGRVILEAISMPFPLSRLTATTNSTQAEPCTFDAHAVRSWGRGKARPGGPVSASADAREREMQSPHALRGVVSKAAISASEPVNKQESGRAVTGPCVRRVELRGTSCSSGRLPQSAAYYLAEKCPSRSVACCWKGRLGSSSKRKIRLFSQSIEISPQCFPPSHSP